MQRLALLIIAFIFLLQLGCATKQDEPTVSGTLATFAVWPPATDPSISIIYPTPVFGIVQDSHFVALHRGVSVKNRLFIFLPGTGGVPRNYRGIVTEAAKQGYHAIGLTYQNPIAVGTYCTSGDANCTGNIRYEMLDGTDRSSLLVVSRANSIENRLIKLIQQLNTQYPQDGWAQFAPGGNINWQVISLAGHSQGGGHAAFIGKVRSLLRVGMFATPADIVTPGNTLPAWFSLSAATPASSYFGFTSTADELNAYSLVSFNWTGLGLGTAATAQSIDGNLNGPYAGRWFITSSSIPRNPGLAIGPQHNLPVVDVNVPLNTDGSYSFAPLWRYMCLPD